MDAVISSAAAGAYEWPTTFTTHERLRSFELAVLAKNSSGLLLAAIVGAEETKARPFLVLRTAKPLKDLKYTIRRANAPEPAAKDVPVTGEFITIPLTLPSSGDYSFTASGHLTNGTLVGLPLTFRYE
jgi:hypothetical protein